MGRLTDAPFFAPEPSEPVPAAQGMSSDARAHLRIAADRRQREAYDFFASAGAALPAPTLAEGDAVEAHVDGMVWAGRVDRVEGNQVRVACADGVYRVATPDALRPQSHATRVAQARASAQSLVRAAQRRAAGPGFEERHAPLKLNPDGSDVRLQLHFNPHVQPTNDEVLAYMAQRYPAHRVLDAEVSRPGLLSVVASTSQPTPEASDGALLARTGQILESLGAQTGDFIVREGAVTQGPNSVVSAFDVVTAEGAPVFVRRGAAGLVLDTTLREGARRAAGYATASTDGEALILGDILLDPSEPRIAAADPDADPADADPEHLGGPGITLARRRMVQRAWREARGRDARAGEERLILKALNANRAAVTAQRADARLEALMKARQQGGAAQAAVDDLMVRYLSKNPDAMAQLDPNATQQLLGDALNWYQTNNPKRMNTLLREMGREDLAVERKPWWKRMVETPQDAVDRAWQEMGGDDVPAPAAPAGPAAPPPAAEEPLDLGLDEPDAPVGAPQAPEQQRVPTPEGDDPFEFDLDEDAQHEQHQFRFQQNAQVDVDGRHVHTPGLAHFPLRLDAVHRSGGYLVARVSWDPDAARDLSARQVLGMVRTFLLTEASRDSWRFGIVSRLRCREIDVDAGRVVVMFAASGAHNFPPEVVESDDDPPPEPPEGVY